MARELPRLALRARAGLRGTDQLCWLERLERETENLASVTRVLFDRRDFETRVLPLVTLYLYLWIGGYLGVVRRWGEELLEIAGARTSPSTPRTRAIAEYYSNAVRFWQEPAFESPPG